jgi:hypothetical protein
MAQYDHENRIKRLEKTVNQLTSIVKAAGLFDDFVPLSQAAKLLNLLPSCILPQSSENLVGVSDGQDLSRRILRFDIFLDYL